MNLHTPLVKINHISKSLGTKLKKLGLLTVQDLLFFLPFRYEDYSQVREIDSLSAGEQVSIRGRVEVIKSRRSWKSKKLITEAVVADESGRLPIIWFGQTFITKILNPGAIVYLSGKVTDSKIGLQMVNPAYEKESAQKARGEVELTHTGRIVPMYHLTSGITQKQIRFLVSQIIYLAEEIKEWIPDNILERADLIPLSEAMRGIHFPIDDTDLQQAIKRLKFGELYILQLRAEMVRQTLKRFSAERIVFQEKEIKNFVNSLPFHLTQAQRIAAWEILCDMEKDEPMNRLLEGDVGSGKTVVAALALYNSALNDFQGVLMAPTEILSRQHYDSLNKLLGDKLRIALLTHSQFLISNFQFSNKAKISNDKISKPQVIKAIKNGEVDIIIGTHALLSEKVEFNKLGLVIVDEQHRFGVEQRKTIKEKTNNSKILPHFLSMTATPIPRSFALTLYGDLDLSIINEMPAERKIIKTRVVESYNRAKAYDFIRNQVKKGRQVFVICPLISQKSIKSESQKFTENYLEILNYPDNDFINFDEKKTVMSEYERLSKQIFPDLAVGYLHGKLKAKEKEEVMNKFSSGELDILVSTSVVEVGVNIPNASVMMIEGAERFGLAQLHQFRGRVGRSNHQSYCFVFTDTDNEKALERLHFFENNHDGFKVAEYDLQTRGPGEVYGTNQSGVLSFRLASMKDTELIKLSRDLAKGTNFEENKILKEKVKEWERGVHLE
jgi:ATP-dependent DNA helicase RecG